MRYTSIDRLLCLLLLCVLASGAVRSQPGQYALTNRYSNENGLPQNSIVGIVQDRMGYIWLATQMGLVRFDGQNFKSCDIQSVAPNTSNRISSLGVFNGQVYCAAEGLLEETVHGNSSWIRIQEQQLLPIVEHRSMFYHQNNFVSMDSLPAHIRSEITGRLNPNHFFFDPGTQTGYYSYSFNPDFYYFDRSKRIKNTVPKGTAFDFRNRVYLNRTLFFYYPEKANGFSNEPCLIGFYEGKQLASVQGSLLSIIKQLSAEERQYAYFLFRDQHALFITGNRAYLVSSPQVGILNAELICSNLQQGGSSSNFIRFLYLPERHLLFLGSSTDGLLVYKKAVFETWKYALPQTAKTLVRGYDAANSIFALQPIADSFLLTARGLITRSGESRYPQFNGQLELLSIPKTASNKVLIPSKLYQQLPVDFRKRHFIIQPDDGRNYGRGFATQEDTLYISSWVLKEQADRLTLVDSFPQVPKIANIFCLLIQGDSIWFGTEKGLVIANRFSKATRQIPELTNKIIRHLSRDSFGNVWIGTYGSGWYKYTQDRLLVRMPTDPQQYLNHVHSVVEDQLGYTWASTNNGLFRFATSDLVAIRSPDEALFYNYFAKESGILNAEFNGGCQPSVATFTDGSLAFPSMKGIVYVQPSAIPVERIYGSIFIDDFQVDGKSVSRQNILALSPEFNELGIQVSLPYWGNRYNLHIEYQLSGGSNRWTQLDAKGWIRLNRLQPGSYTISIRYLKDFGSRQYQLNTILFTVKPHWYQSTWFFLATAFGLVGLTYAIARRRSMLIRRRNAQLEREVEKRTLELVQSQEALKETVKFRSKVTALVLHDIRSPLYYLNKITQRVYKQSEHTVQPAMREQLKDLHLSVSEISDYAQNLFTWLNTQDTQLDLSKQAINVYELLEEITSKYLLLAKEQETAISFRADQSLIWYAPKDLLHIVLRNLVDNAVKYTKGGHVKITAEQINEKLCVVVQDTGIGMSAKKVKQLLEADLSELFDQQHNGMGFMLIRDILSKIQGEIALESTEGIGSRITISVPTYH